MDPPLPLAVYLLDVAKEFDWRLMNVTKVSLKRARCAGFSLVESIMGMAVFGIAFLSLYGGLASGFSTIRMARENLRATQIILEKMETIRLYNWEQLNTKDFVPTTFQGSYYPPGQTNGVGVVYNGTVSLKKANLGANYDDDMALLTVQVDWTTGGVSRSRSQSTYVSRYGLQNYVW
jgi:prepilin-type N-terminal cleavage/methylation domain-containing protein